MTKPVLIAAGYATPSVVGLAVLAMLRNTPGDAHGYNYALIAFAAFLIVTVISGACFLFALNSTLQSLRDLNGRSGRNYLALGASLLGLAPLAYFLLLAFLGDFRLAVPKEPRQQSWPARHGVNKEFRRMSARRTANRLSAVAMLPRTTKELHR